MRRVVKQTGKIRAGEEENKKGTEDVICMGVNMHLARELLEILERNVEAEWIF